MSKIAENIAEIVMMMMVMMAMMMMMMQLRIHLLYYIKIISLFE